MTFPLAAKYEQACTYRKSTLDNGLRIVTEAIPHLHSVSVGIWVRSGSRFEKPRLNGICHFIEHMLFKGTHRRSAYEISREIDSVGGGLNAFTSKELTSFYCRVLEEHMELAVDLLTDIFLNPSFPEEEIEREKQVVCEEIHQMEDSPEDYVHEILGTRFWGDDPLGQPILGTVQNIMTLGRDTLMSFQREAYSPDQTVVAAAGRVDHERFVELIEPVMGKLSRRGVREPTSPPRVDESSHIVRRDLEQVHICVGAQGPSAVDESRHAGYILNTILGGGMSSRLFQEVREKRGLAYSVYSFLHSFSDTGMLGIYAGCDPGRVEELLAVLGKETARLAGTLTEEDIQTAKQQIKGNVILAAESSEARMNRLAKGEHYFGRLISLDEIIAALEGVTEEELAVQAEKMVGASPISIVALGPVSEDGDIFGAFRQ